MRIRSLLWLALSLPACGETTVGDDPADPGQQGAVPDAGPDAAPPPAPEAPPDWCQGATKFVYEPTAGDALHAFPDDYYTAPAETPTGRRIALDTGNAPWLEGQPTIASHLYAALPTLDGWGTTAAISLRFSAPLPAFEPGPVPADAGLAIFDLGGSEPVRVPFEVRAFDEGRRVFLWPLVPLRPGAEHAVVMTNDFLAADGDCVAPSETLAALLTGTAADERLAALQQRYLELPGRLGWPRDLISAAVLFTTQSIADESLAVAADVAGRSIAWAEPPTCRSARRGVRPCEGRMAAHEYRIDGVLAGTTPQSDYELPVSLWLPAEGEGPWPVIVVGHGLGGDRSLGGVLAEVMNGQAAFVAIDAVGHGDHPTHTNRTQIGVLTDFFEIDIGRKVIDVLHLRDNWRQSTYDKLQLVQLLRAHADVDGDGAADLDTDHLAYFGASLGGLMGPELLAVGRGFGAAALSMPGGRLARTVAESPSFEALVGTVTRGMSPDDVEQTLAVLQTGLERGDPVNYGPHVFAERLPGTGDAPNTLLQEAIDDAIVPNSSTDALARAMRVPLVPKVLADVPLLEVVGRAPVRGNFGAATAGLFQYDVMVPYNGGSPQPATHDNLVAGRHTIHQLLRFFDTWLEQGTATIIDPFAELGRPRP